MRAVVENFGEDVHDLPPVNVVLVKGEQDMTIKISDLGGGIPRPDIPRVFTYLYTTAKLPEVRCWFQGSISIPGKDTLPQ
jgi:pyruvate dehydrogenase kinase 2/3/4